MFSKRKEEKGYAVKNGHRQRLTEITVQEIGKKSATKKTAPKAEVKKTVTKKTTAPKAETKKVVAKKPQLKPKKLHRLNQKKRVNFSKYLLWHKKRSW